MSNGVTAGLEDVLSSADPQETFQWLSKLAAGLDALLGPDWRNPSRGRHLGALPAWVSRPHAVAPGESDFRNIEPDGPTAAALALIGSQLRTEAAERQRLLGLVESERRSAALHAPLTMPTRGYLSSGTLVRT